MSDLERRLEDVFMNDSRSRRVTSVDVPTRRSHPARAVLFIGATAAAVLALAVSINILRGVPPDTTSLASPGVTASATPTLPADVVVRCGQTTQFVAPTATTPGSFVIASAGREERVIVPAGSGIAAAGGYNCVSIKPASGELVAMIPIGGAGYVPEPSSSATPAPGGAARPDASHGMLTRNPAAIRIEADTTPLNKVSNWDEGAAAAVSPDGKRVAILRSGQTGQGIITFTTVKPDEITTVLDMAGTGELLVGPPVWAADGSDSLLVGVIKPGAQSGVDPPPAYSALRSIDMKTHTVTELTRITNNYVLAPVVWHPGGSVAAAYETGAGGFAVNYVVVRGGQMTRTSFGGSVVAGSVVANQDGTRVLAIEGTGGGSVRWWPFDRLDQGTELKPAAGEGVFRAYWRAGRDEIVVAVDKNGPTSTPRSPSASRLEVWGSQSGRRVVRDSGGLALVRVDGTAAIAADYQLVDLTTGATAPVQKRAATEFAYLAVLF
jgi:hypothetical protein